ncbi:unnamed protein product [Caenorhabditis auriculariae]|uniref:Uncharacterized protein n=1 Tax=Caenorhabditis auriculariae TaxID=2777116 RepID=A0A8S1HNU5_9PELO|nr:unnamed protein product [Caenorhabditis auriculariae]
MISVIIGKAPYGVREKARKLGKKEQKSEKDEAVNDFQRYPEKQVYHLEDTYTDLLDLAADICTINGRVSFWYPVILENYSEENLPRHPALQLIYNCEQGLTRKSSRRLLTYRKIREPEIGETAKIPLSGVSLYRNALFSS